MTLAQVVCQGSNVDHLAIKCILDTLQGYAACRGVAFMGCSFDDEALQAVAGLLQKGCGKWWTGPKLQLREITAQQHQQPTAGELLRLQSWKQVTQQIYHGTKHDAAITPRQIADRQQS